MSESYTMILVIAILLIILVLVFALIVSRSNLHQQMAIQKMLVANNDSENAKRMDFENHLNGQMLAYQNGIEDAFRAELSRLNQAQSSQINRLDARVTDSLLRGFEKTNVSFHHMREEVIRIRETQENLKHLSESIQDLEQVLTDKKTRGVFGEVELYSLLKQTFGDNVHRWDRQVHLQNGTIADAVLYTPQPLGMICIDSKFPLENYNRMYSEQLSPLQIAQAKAAFVRDVKKHIQDIADKYIEVPETAEIAYMFIPAEAVFAEIYGHFEEIVTYSYERNVYIVSPTTLMAYLTAIQSIYLGQERNAKMEEIQAEYGKLANEFERFEKRFAQVAQDFKRTNTDLHDLEVTFGKLDHRFHEIQEVKLEGNQRDTQ